MTNEERIEQLEKAVRYLASRVLGEGPQSDPVALAAAETAAHSGIDPELVKSGFADVSEAMTTLSSRVDRVAEHQAAETAAMVAARVEMDPASKELIEVAAKRAGVSIEEFTKSALAAYNASVAQIMGADDARD